MRWLLILLSLPCVGADYLVINDTNTSLPPGFATWRTFVEPESFISLGTQWVDAVTFTDTNGTRKIHQQAVIITNRTIRFTYKGSVWVEHEKPDTGPVVDKRVLEVPMPLPAPQVPLRTTNRFRLKTNVVMERVP